MEPNTLSTPVDFFSCELPFSVSSYPIACLHGEETLCSLHVAKQTFLVDFLSFDI